MAQDVKDVIEVLNDLIRINNDRTAGYMRAAEDTKNVDVDLRTIFERMADESRQNAIELTAQVGRLGGEPATGQPTGAVRKIFRDEPKSTSIRSHTDPIKSSISGYYRYECHLEKPSYNFHN